MISIARGLGKTEKLVDALVPILKMGHSTVLVGTRKYAERVRSRLAEKGVPCHLILRTAFTSMPWEKKEERGVFDLIAERNAYVVLLSMAKPLDYGTIIQNRHNDSLTVLSKMQDRRVIEKEEQFNFSAWTPVVPYLVEDTFGEYMLAGDLIIWDGEPRKAIDVSLVDDRKYQRIVKDLRVNHLHIHECIPGHESAQWKIVRAVREGLKITG